MLAPTRWRSRVARRWSPCGCGGGDDADGRPAGARAASPAAERRPHAAPRSRRAARGVRLRAVGDFDAPVYVTSPPGDRARQFVVEQGGRVMVVRDGRKLRHAVPRHPRPGHRGRRAGAALDRLRARLRRQRAASTSTSPTTTGDQRIVEYRRRDADRADPGSARLVLRMADSRVQPQRRPAAVRAGRPDVRRHGRRRRRRRPARRARQRAEPRLAARARSCGSTRAPAAGAPTRCPAATRSSAAAGARGEIYSLRAAQPVALLVRPQDGRPEHRRRRPERVRGDRLRARAARAAARTSAGARSRAARATRPASRRRGTSRPVDRARRTSDGNCSITGGVVVRDRVARACAGATCSATSARGRIESARLSPGRARGVRRDLAEACRASPRSARTRRAASTSSRSTGPVYRIVPR